jgi:hypothetical protein
LTKLRAELATARADLERVTARAEKAERERDEWRTVAESAQAALREAGNDIAALTERAAQKHGSHLVNAVTFGGEVLSIIRAHAAKVKPADPFHPNGRCTCNCEGSCEWCATRCDECGDYAVGPSADDVPLCEACWTEAEKAVKR